MSYLVITGLLPYIFCVHQKMKEIDKQKVVKSGVIKRLTAIVSLNFEIYFPPSPSNVGCEWKPKTDGYSVDRGSQSLFLSFVYKYWWPFHLLRCTL